MNTIVIIDEAHNIESQAEEGLSIKMDILNLDKAEADLQQIFDSLKSNSNKINSKV